MSDEDPSKRRGERFCYPSRKRASSDAHSARLEIVQSKRLTRVDRVACLRGKQERRGARSLDTAQRVEPICPCRRLSLRSVVIDGEDRAQLTGRLWWCR